MNNEDLNKKTKISGITIGVACAIAALAVLVSASYLSKAGILWPVRQAPLAEIKQPLKFAGKKVLFVDSYHEGYAWSDGIVRGLMSELEETGVDIRIVRMDTKRNPDEDSKIKAAKIAKEEIERYAPNVVIACDDNAFKYLIMPYYRDVSLPVVFCGLNWDAGVYGAPYVNTTGMVEVSLTKRLIETLSNYAAGVTVGYLSADTETERKNVEFYDKLLGLKFEATAFVLTMDGWEKAFEDMQSEVDILIFENNAGIVDWDDARASAFAREHSKIPAGTTNEWIMPTVLIGLTKIPEEQGAWSAKATLEILGGKMPSEIPQAANKRGDTFLNLTLAEKLGITFRNDLIRNAKTVQ